MSNRIRTLIVGLLIVAAVIVASCAPAPTAAPVPAPVAKKPITISLNVDLTGPLATNFRYQYRAYQDFWGEVNKNGGIDGIQVNPIWTDSKYDSQQSVTNWKKSSAAGTVLHFSTGSVENEPLKDTFLKEQIPVFAPGSHTPSLLKPTPYTIYSCYPNYTEYTSGPLDWMKKDWAKRGNTGRPRMGFLGFQISATQPILDTGPIYAEKIGVDWGPVEITPMTVLDVKANVKRLADAGCNYVYTSHMSGTPSTFLRDAVAMGVKDKMIWLVNNVDKASVVASPDAMEGVMMLAVFPTFADDSPGMTRIKDVQLKNHGELSEEGQYFSMWRNSMVALGALKIAVKDVGSDKLNGAAVINAIGKLKNLDMEGLQPPITMADPNERECFYGMKIIQVKSKNFVNYSDWFYPEHMILYNGKLVPLP